MTQDSTIEKIIHILSELQSQVDEKRSSKVADVNNNEHVNPQIINNNENRSETPIKEKRSFLWSRLRQGLKKIGKVKNESSNHGSESGGSQGRNRNKSITKDQEEADLVIQKLRYDILQMKDAFANLSHFQTDMSKSLEADFRSKKLKAILEKTDSIKSRSYDLKEIRRKIFYLKCQIPSLLYKQTSRGLSITGSETAEENDVIDETSSDLYLPGLHVSKDFKSSEAFEEVVEKFQSLEFTRKLCLLSFAVFPENREVKKTMLMYWWIGEDFLGYDGSEDTVTGILDELSTKRLLEPVEDERKLKPNSYKMEPHVHSAVIFLAQLVGLYELYNGKGKPFMDRSKWNKVRLVKGSSSQQEPKVSETPLKNLNTVFNSTERYPDFTFKWFSEMESLRVLYLGRWERTAKRHIEVENTKFLNNMKALKNLRLASFQGISRIEKLENPICALPKLVILDLRACYNLEELPKDIGSLKSLIYLDISECYMLDRMPEGIADLSRLQVLKGFVINESDDESHCAVRNLLQLRKLGITVNKSLFKVECLMESLRNLDQLQSLKIAWGALKVASGEDTRGGKSKKTKEAARKKEMTKVEEVSRRDPATVKDLKGQENDQVLEKKQKSEEKKGDAQEKGWPQVGSGDAVDSKKEDVRNEKDDVEEGKKRDMVKAASLKSDKIAEGDKKASSSQDLTDPIQNKPDDDKAKTKVEGDGDKGKVKLEAGKKDDEIKAESSKSDNTVKGDMKASLPQVSTNMIPNKPDDKSKVENKGDENKEEVNEADKKASSSQDSTDTIQNKQGDQKGKNKVEKEGDGDKGKTDPEEGKKRDEVEAETSKSDNGVKGDKNASPVQESTDAIQNKPNDQQGKSKVEKEEDGDKRKVAKEEGNKQVEAESLKSDNGIEGDKKAGPLQESTDAIKNKPDDQKGKSKEGKDGDGDKDKDSTEEGKKRDEVEAETSKSDNGVGGDKKATPLQESTEEIQSKPDENQIDEKQEEKGDGEEEEADLEEGKKRDGVQEQSSKPDKVIEGDEKTNPPQESKDMIQSKTDDLKDNSKVREKGAGEKARDDLEVAKKLDEGEAKTQKSDKISKYGKKVSFSEESIAQLQKKPDDLKGGNAMRKEVQETASPSKPEQTAHKETRWHKTALSIVRNRQTRRWETGWHDNSATDNPKLPSSLKKLELECFPEKEPPTWLHPRNLDNLKKLSIKGGKLSRISDEPPSAENKCRVEILRLKYLIEFKAEWKDLQAMFPQMILLEKYRCPKIAFCPTDGNGVWRLQSQASPDTPE